MKIGDVEIFVAGAAANLATPAPRAARDVVVTVPAWFWAAWLEEGDLPGEPESGAISAFSLGSRPPNVAPGSRVYVVAHRRLRGWAPLVKLGYQEGRYWLIRKGGAVACTIPQRIRGFRGFRYRWWERSEETPFDDWKRP